MSQRFHIRRSEQDDRRWLSMLIDAMEETARPEIRNVPCDKQARAAVEAQLARPAVAYPWYGSFFSFFN
ncbi:hypothetical protein I6F35_03680 [Bradyrhizobium sp. BRP22]|uniref:hypothetical protein n=1 Tax=Bradyrhizobium sp. BRP22 TaxID=2793821 RepID=UPI001CD256EE|nr:hypothetical protein [Bradyrhizobium sp. BRP22]MCA1452318.1 hypothetical protein [Bradyrhizobium sp. BRP22]